MPASKRPTAETVASSPEGARIETALWYVARECSQSRPHPRARGLKRPVAVAHTGPGTSHPRPG